MAGIGLEPGNHQTFHILHCDYVSLAYRGCTDCLGLLFQGCKRKDTNIDKYQDLIDIFLEFIEYVRKNKKSIFSKSIIILALEMKWNENIKLLKLIRDTCVWCEDVLKILYNLYIYCI